MRRTRPRTTPVHNEDKAADNVFSEFVSGVSFKRAGSHTVGSAQPSHTAKAAERPFSSTQKAHRGLHRAVGNNGDIGDQASEENISSDIRRGSDDEGLNDKPDTSKPKHPPGAGNVNDCSSSDDAKDSEDEDSASGSDPAVANGHHGHNGGSRRVLASSSNSDDSESSKDADSDADFVAAPCRRIKTSVSRGIANTVAAAATARPVRASARVGSAAASARIKAQVAAISTSSEMSSEEGDTESSDDKEVKSNGKESNGSKEDGRNKLGDLGAAGSLSDRNEGGKAAPTTRRTRGDTGPAPRPPPARFQPVRRPPPKLAAPPLPAAESSKRPAAAPAEGDNARQQAGSGGSGSDSEEDEEDEEDEEKGKPAVPLACNRAQTADKVEMILERDGNRFLCKLRGFSYRKLQWVTQGALERHKAGLMRAYIDRMRRDDPPENAPEWQVVQRVVAARKAPVTRRREGSSPSCVPPVQQYLVKWKGLDYSQCTWEHEEHLISAEDQEQLSLFGHYNRKRPAKVQTLQHLRAKMRWAPPDKATAEAVAGTADRRAVVAAKIDPSCALSGQVAAVGVVKKTAVAGSAAVGESGLQANTFAMPSFLNGRSLRDYQDKSVRWMVNNFAHLSGGRHEPVNCILGDEMGLGKTAQSISALEVLRRVGNVQGPFLIVAPLTTLGHWQREIQTWTDMNVIVYAGNAEDRATIEAHEFSNAHGQIKFDAMLVSYDMLLKDQRVMRGFRWAVAVLDEAHKLKGINSSTRAAVMSLDVQWKLLLTGTPIQNNMGELFSMMNLLDPEQYGTIEGFYRRFGGGEANPTVKQVLDLQAALRPLLLRRMKEDVETLPEKEEVIIWVELTTEQRTYYKALYARQIGALLGGVNSKNLPGMRNLAMELRKLCCHPFLCEGLEEDMLVRWEEEGRSIAGGRAELMARASGKMTLLGKLLPKLRAEGHRVLVFSQFKIMLDLLQEYLEDCGYPAERIDGSTKGRSRQQAIDRFMSDEGDSFVFLLSTRAGGQGITLTSADVIIIYDSDWNPQNDLQAMARCHRIGQDKEVKVYRLVSKDTYEEQLFEVASRKYGLDEAILGFSAGADPEADAGRIANLLQNGAHSLAQDKGAAAAEFAKEDIDQILAGRTEKRQIGSKAGNTFSTVRFAVGEEAGAGEAGAGAGAAGTAGRNVWVDLLPEAVAAYKQKLNAPLAPRRRAAVNYCLDGPGSKRSGGKGGKKTDKPPEDDHDEDFSAGGDAGAASDNGDTEPGEPDATAKSLKKRNAEAGAPKVAALRKWSVPNAKLLIDGYISQGARPGAWQRLHQQLKFSPSRSLEEVEGLGHHIEVFVAALIALDKLAQTQAASNVATGAAAQASAAAPLLSLAPKSLDTHHVTEMEKKRQGVRREMAEALERMRLVHEKMECVAKTMMVPPHCAALQSKDVVRHLCRNCLHLEDALVQCRALHEVASREEAGPFRVPAIPLRMHVLPDWWQRYQDEDLLTGALKHGYQGTWNAKRVLEATLLDPEFGFHRRVGPAPHQGGASCGGTEEAAGPAEDQQAAITAPAADEGTEPSAATAAVEPGATTAQGKQLLTPNSWRTFTKHLTKRLLDVIKYTLHPEAVPKLQNALPVPGRSKPLAVPPATPPGAAGAAKPAPAALPAATVLPATALSAMAAGGEPAGDGSGGSVDEIEDSDSSLDEPFVAQPAVLASTTKRHPSVPPAAAPAAKRAKAAVGGFAAAAPSSRATVKGAAAPTPTSTATGPGTPQKQGELIVAKLAAPAVLPAPADVKVSAPTSKACAKPHALTAATAASLRAAAAGPTAAASMDKPLTAATAVKPRNPGSGQLVQSKLSFQRKLPPASANVPALSAGTTAAVVAATAGSAAAVDVIMLE